MALCLFVQSSVEVYVNICRFVQAAIVIVPSCFVFLIRIVSIVFIVCRAAETLFFFSNPSWCV